MATLKLGKMEKDYCDMMPGEPKEDDKMVERFPTVYINMDTLPDLTPGQEVTLKGVVTSFSDKKVRSKEDGKSEVDVVRNCEIDILEMTPGAKKDVSDPPETDEDAIDKGLNKATEEEPETDDESEEDDE